MNFYYYINFLWACIFLLFIINVNVFAQGKYPIQNFPPSTYKGGNQNIDFAQNRAMTLFVANNLGILSYNGKEWNLHTFEVGKKKRSLAFDEINNRLYVGLQGEFGYFSEDWHYISLVDLIPDGAKDFDEVWDVFCLNSKIFFCTFQHIYTYDGGKITVISHNERLDRAFIFENKLFTQNYKGELLELMGEQLVKTTINLEGEGIIAGLITHDDQPYAFLQSGEIQTTNTNDGDHILTPLSNALKGTYINHVLQLSDTRLAISTQTAGLYLYDLQSHIIEQISINEGLLTNACLRSFQDFSGNLWVGMQNGIALIDINSPMRLINEDIQIQGSGYEAYETEEGTYFTTSNGIYFKAKTSKHSIFLQGTEGPAYSIQNIAGKIYAGHHAGLFLLEQNEAKQIVKTEGIWEVKLLKTHPKYAIGGTYSGLYLFELNENRELEPLHKITGFNESSRFFEEDKKGRIWVGQFYKGLFQLNLSDDLKSFQTQKISKNQNAPVGEQVLLSRIDNELYFSTKEGIYMLDQHTDEIVPASLFQKDIGKHPVYLLKQDKKKNIHVYANNMFGFYKQISANNYVFIPSSLYQLRYSFNNDLLHTSTHTSNGIMINANEGFIHYNPEKENRLLIDNPLVVSQVYSVIQDSILYKRSIFEERPNKINALTISDKAKVIQFFIESFQLKEVNNQLFQYFLEGFDQEYGNWTTATRKEYTNLKAGDYAFKVRTRNVLGDLVESEPIIFTITPPFYRSTLAKLLYFLLFLLSLLGIFLYQKRIYKHRTLNLEKQKQRELAENQRKLDNIEKQKQKELAENQRRLDDIEKQKQKELEENKRRLDDIEKQNQLKLLQLKEEQMESELEHLNKLLAAATMNMVAKNEFINSIKEKLQEVNHDKQNGATKKFLMQIEKEIDSNLKLEKEWEQFEYHFNHVHGDFLTRIRTEFYDLSPNDQKLCAFLRLNLSTKEISKIMNISHRGVEIARYRLRKKLKLSKGENLLKFVLGY